MSAALLQIGTRVEGGDNADDYDTGTVTDVDDTQTVCTVQWDRAGFATTMRHPFGLRRIGARVYAASDDAADATDE